MSLTECKARRILPPPFDPIPPDFALPRDFPSIQHLQVISHPSWSMNLWQAALQEQEPQQPSSDSFHPKLKFCDLLARALTLQWTRGPPESWTLSQAAGTCQHWPEWEDVKAFYEGPVEVNGNHAEEERHPNKLSFQHEKVPLMGWLYCFLTDTIPIKEFITGLYALACVRCYLHQLYRQQYAAALVGRVLFPTDQPLQAALATYQGEKWDALMVAAFVLKEMHGEEGIDEQTELTFPCLYTFRMVMRARGQAQRQKRKLGAFKKGKGNGSIRNKT